MYQHFSRVAASYNEIRTTDLEPIIFIKERCNNNHKIEAVDIGVGSGRYCLKLFEHLDNLYLTCIDINVSMLEETSNCLAREGITDFKTIQSPAEDIPLADNSIDYIFVFNAIHHFNLKKFMARAARVLKDGGEYLHLHPPAKPERQEYLGQVLPSIPRKRGTPLRTG